MSSIYLDLLKADNFDSTMSSMRRVAGSPPPTQFWSTRASSHGSRRQAATEHRKVTRRRRCGSCARGRRIQSDARPQVRPLLAARNSRARPALVARLSTPPTLDNRSHSAPESLAAHCASPIRFAAAHISSPSLPHSQASRFAGFSDSPKSSFSNKTVSAGSNAAPSFILPVLIVFKHVGARSDRRPAHEPGPR